MCNLANADSSTSFRAKERFRFDGWAGSDGDVGSGEIDRLDFDRPMLYYRVSMLQVLFTSLFVGKV